ncbi:unnamed protein product [Phytophthora fragariaefolia]|uniref:Ribosomal RNA-processing protein 8 n=1 Tax=Phytophthora fragariaefolia TaxID=1490495 RepID=A0A9W7CXS3_9STRA|nr:unnamed protein product [Phytophthora fragariaefolia]
MDQTLAPPKKVSTSTSMGKKGRKGGSKGGAKGKPASAGGGKKVKQKSKTQQVAAVPKAQHKSQQKQGKAKAKKALTPAERLAEMRRKIDGGKFRMLNEQLYTTTGDSAFSTFQSDPALFDVYHHGFREMADKWPTNPLDTFIDYVKCVADCIGLERVLVLILALFAIAFAVLVDIGVYCLALMGTSVREYVREVHRVLKPGGVLKIAEVKSRFESEALGGIEGFVQTLRKMGFDCKQKDERNKMFVLFELVKSTRKPQKVGPIEFKACEYKRR